MNFWKSKLSSVDLYPKQYIRMGYIYKVNHEYFEEIDNEYKAYILGLIYADGCIWQPVGNRQLQLRINLQEEDGYILEKFATEAGGRDVKTTHYPSNVSKQWKKTSTVDIHSTKMCQTLIGYGCNIQKSRVGMTFPKLDETLIPHFIRGFMDGDGSIIIKPLGYKYKRKTTYTISTPHVQRYKLRVAFCSTDKTFLEKLFEHLPIKKFYMAKRITKQTVYILWIENTNDVQSCLTYLYQDAYYFLRRKHDKLEEFNKIIKSEATGAPVERLETT